VVRSVVWLAVVELARSAVVAVGAAEVGAVMSTSRPLGLDRTP
jgi:hypothetical protein